MGVGELEGFCLGGGGHFLPGFAEGVDDLVLSGFSGEVSELIFQENEAKGVFQNTAIRVLREILLEIQVLDADDRVVRVTDLAENFTRFLGMKLFEGGSPAEITRAIHWIRVAGNLPAAEVLATRGEEKFLGGGRAEFEDPIGEPLGHENFARAGYAIDLLDIWVGCVMFIKQSNGGLKSIRGRRVRIHESTCSMIG